jgi:F0F1-type ATP synthase assembly protein I
VRNAKPSGTDRSSGSREFARRLALAMDLPAVLVGSMLAGGGVGYLVDEALHSWPWGTLTLGGLGFAGGLWAVVRSLTQTDGSEDAGS